MKEIKVGQIWKRKFGNKANPFRINIIKKLNKYCWEVEMANEQYCEILTEKLIREEYLLES